ncbi:MAG: hydantoinase/oxoprolinase family protein [Proteobacteria bacterium]|nr:hydantoinase/oxoprolinase family protein [Pseudomonadota bacterium]MBI3497428.1 hydantoinase/oxoprolinase family protein [Pseudomonadota bacterium]
MAEGVRHRLAVDIGGTFTDVVLEGPKGRVTTKVLTTPAAPELGVIDGIEAVLRAAALAPEAIDLFIHGTTLATNALIERKGAKTAFITTAGIRDILEMGYEKRFEQYDVYMDRPAPLVERELRIGVGERVTARGRVLRPLDEEDVRQAALQINESGAEAVAVGLIHAYAYPEHERRVRELLAGLLPKSVTICLSSEVCPEIREYERFSTTCANAYVRPLMAGYLTRLRVRLDAIGLRSPLFLMMSGGGLTTLEHATRFPIRLVESGPAGGVILAGQIARECALDAVLAFDMGGTTAKICLLDDYEPERARRFEVARMYRDLKGSGLPVRIPVIEMVEIGAGGGSIARVDAMQRITVGPDSVGADPGPACYARGGSKATVTDANVALGRIDPQRFAGGRIPLDPERATAAIAGDVGAKLKLDGHWPAAGISEIVEENMANAARVHAIERGKVIDRYTMVAFGGGAPLHAGRLAEKLGIMRVIVPVGAGVGSAIGFLRAPIAYEVVRSWRVAFDELDLAAANRLLTELGTEARGVVAAGAAGAPIRVTRLVDVRYVGQGHELPMSLSERTLVKADFDDLRQRFEARYRQIYGLHLPAMAVEIVTWSVTASTILAETARVSSIPRRPVERSRERRPVYEPALGGLVEMPVHRRSDLVPGVSIEGPAVIVEDETTTIVPSSFAAMIDRSGYIVMEAKSHV